MKIKLPLTLTLALLLGSLTTSAQYNPIQLGIQLSPTFSYMGTDNNLIEGDGTKLGLKLGLIAEYFFQDEYSIHSGINIHFGSGGKLRYDDSSNGFTSVNIWNESLNETYVNPPTSAQLAGATFDYGIQFVEIPLGLTLRTREFGYIRYFVRPQIALGIVTSTQGSVEDAPGINADDNFNIGPEVNALNLNWGIGGGIEYSISTSSSLIGGIGFQSGILDLTTDNDTSLERVGRTGPEEDNSKGRVNAITIMLGVMF